MIKGITGSGRYIQVTGGYASVPAISTGSYGAGTIRWNSNIGCFEVNDGVSWRTFEMAHPSVSLTGEAEMLLDWAKKKMTEEQEMSKLAENHPAVKIALENLNKAQEQLKATVILSKEHNEQESAG